MLQYRSKIVFKSFGIPLFNLTDNINHIEKQKNLLAFFKYSMHANVDK